MNTDLNQIESKVTPAVEAKEFPLAFMRLLHTQASSPSEVRAYAEFCPYRRIMGDVETVPAVTHMDEATGEIIVDTPAVITNMVVGAEFKSPEVDGDITVIESSNLMAIAQTDEAGTALVEQTLGAFAMAGGNIPALALACLLLAFKAEGVRQGKFLP